MAGNGKSNGEPSARAAVLHLLRQVLDRRRALDEALAEATGPDGVMARLRPRDRAFGRLLTATVLRRLGQLDGVIEACLQRPLADGAGIVRHILRLGAAQLLFLETPAHAAVDTTVDLVPRHLAKFRGLVNAVLRRLARDGPVMVAGQDGPRLNTPDWLWQSWTGTYGEAAARAMAATHAEEPPLDFTLKDSAETVKWAEALVARPLPWGGLRRPGGGRVEDLPGYTDGAWWVQDGAAALPARILLSGLAEDPGTLTAYDLCAAPGGKTAQLAAAGVRVVAVDRSAKRLSRLTANLGRLGLEAETVTAEAGTWQPPGRADLVLLDAPCTSTGTLRRHPDVAYLKSPRDVAKLTALQDRLLAAAANLVRPGGRLVYSVCSLEAEEAEARTAAFLANQTEFKRLAIGAAELGGWAEAITADGDLRTLPCHLPGDGGLDGFYAARFIRIV